MASRSSAFDLGGPGNESAPIGGRSAGRESAFDGRHGDSWGPGRRRAASGLGRDAGRGRPRVQPSDRALRRRPRRVRGRMALGVDGPPRRSRRDARRLDRGACVRLRIRARAPAPAGRWPVPLAPQSRDRDAGAGWRGHPLVRDRDRHPRRARCGGAPPTDPVRARAGDARRQDRLVAARPADRGGHLEPRARGAVRPPRRVVRGRSRSVPRVRPPGRSGRRDGGGRRRGRER